MADEPRTKLVRHVATEGDFERHHQGLTSVAEVLRLMGGQIAATVGYTPDQRTKLFESAEAMRVEIDSLKAHLKDGDT